MGGDGDEHKRYADYDPDEDDLDGDELEEENPGFVMYSMLADPRRSSAASKKSDKIAERLIDEIFDPDPMRSHVITLHLYVEYWLDKLLDLLGAKPAKLTFSGKVAALKDRGALEDQLHVNVVAINRLRNVYAHQLDLEKANAEVQSLLGQLKRDPYFQSTDKDPLRSTCVQTIMLLEATHDNGGKPPASNPFPYEEMRTKLLQTGELFWQECEILRKEEHGYDTTYYLRCPLCLKGTVEREYEGTPGFKDSTLWRCDVCGLTGSSGTTFQLETAKAEYRTPAGTRIGKA